MRAYQWLTMDSIGRQCREGSITWAEDDDASLRTRERG
jgi:hypothetical protein